MIGMSIRNALLGVVLTFAVNASAQSALPRTALLVATAERLLPKRTHCGGQSVTVSDEYLVFTRAGTDARQLAAEFGKRSGVAVLGVWRTLGGLSVRATPEALENLGADPRLAEIMDNCRG
jgi:hypothetical protein